MNDPTFTELDGHVLGEDIIVNTRGCKPMDPKTLAAIQRLGKAAFEAIRRLQEVEIFQEGLIDPPKPADSHSLDAAIRKARGGPAPTPFRGFA